MGTLEGYCFLLTGRHYLQRAVGKANTPCGQSCRASWQPRPIRSHLAWNEPSRHWLRTCVSSMNASRVVERDRGARQPGRWVRTADQHPRHRTDHLQRHGRGNRSRRFFAKGRDFATWLGLVPKQISTGDRTIQDKISNRGNRYLRVLFVQAAWVVLVKMKPARWESHGLKPWSRLPRSGFIATCWPSRSLISSSVRKVRCWRKADLGQNYDVG
jgi:hypothetical protein